MAQPQQAATPAPAPAPAATPAPAPVPAPAPAPALPPFEPVGGGRIASEKEGSRAEAMREKLSSAMSTGGEQGGAGGGVTFKKLHLLLVKLQLLLFLKPIMPAIIGKQENPVIPVTNYNTFMS